MMMGTFKGSRLVAIAAGGIAAFGVVAVSFVAWAAIQNDDAESATEFKTSTQMQTEYRAAEKTYGMNFPEGIELPSPESWSQRYVETSEDDNVMFEEGLGESQLLSIWSCAWQKQYYVASVNEDKPAMAEGERELSGFYDTELARKYYEDPERAFEHEVLLPAFNGDLTPLSENLVNSCDPVFRP